jgi:hypothetical protein
VFSRVSCIIVFLSVFLLCTSGYTATQLSVQGTVSKVTDTSVFLDEAGEIPFFLGATSVLKGVSMASLSELVGKSVSITYHVMAGRNAIETLDVIQ